MSAVESLEQRSSTPADNGLVLLAQALVLMTLVAATAAVCWLYVQDLDWYVPAIVLIVIAGFAYDHFFAED